MIGFGFRSPIPLSHIPRQLSRLFELVRHRVETRYTHPHRWVGGEKVGHEALLVGEAATKWICDAKVGSSPFDHRRRGVMVFGSALSGFLLRSDDK